MEDEANIKAEMRLKALEQGFATLFTAIYASSKLPMNEIEETFKKMKKSQEFAVFKDADPDKSMLYTDEFVQAYQRLLDIALGGVAYYRAIQAEKTMRREP